MVKIVVVGRIDSFLFVVVVGMIVVVVDMDRNYLIAFSVVVENE